MKKKILLVLVSVALLIACYPGVGDTLLERTRQSFNNPASDSDSRDTPSAEVTSKWEKEFEAKGYAKTYICFSNWKKEDVWYNLKFYQDGSGFIIRVSLNIFIGKAADPYDMPWIQLDYHDSINGLSIILENSKGSVFDYLSIPKEAIETENSACTGICFLDVGDGKPRCSVKIEKEGVIEFRELDAAFTSQFLKEMREVFGQIDKASGTNVFTDVFNKPLTPGNSKEFS